jgi:hypothetical protein
MKFVLILICISINCAECDRKVRNEFGSIVFQKADVNATKEALEKFVYSNISAKINFYRRLPNSVDAYLLFREPVTKLYVRKKSIDPCLI